MSGATHLEQVLGTLVALVNSAPPASKTDDLATLQGVRDFIGNRIITEVARPSAGDIAALRIVREQLRAIAYETDNQVRIRLVDAALSSSTCQPRLADHDGLGLHLHFFPHNARVADHILTDCAMAVAELMVSGESERLKRCAVPECGRVFLDLTRNRSRAYCDSRKCGNRTHAAAYRERRRRSAADLEAAGPS